MITFLPWAINAYSPATMTTVSGFITTAELHRFSGPDKHFQIFLPTPGREDGIWSLSEAVFDDREDASQQNLVIYTNQVLFDFERSSESEIITSYSTDGPACEAYYGNTKCNSCKVCGGYKISPSDPWSINQDVGGSVIFDCSGIQPHRRCSGTTAHHHDFDTGHICSHSKDILFQDVSSCFVDGPFDSKTPRTPMLPITAKPVEASTASSSSKANTSTHVSFATILVLSLAATSIASGITMLFVFRFSRYRQNSSQAEYANMQNIIRQEILEEEESPRVVCDKDQWLVVV